MEIVRTVIEGVLIIEPKVFGDKRGYFFRKFLSEGIARHTGSM